MLDSVTTIAVRTFFSRDQGNNRKAIIFVILVQLSQNWQRFWLDGSLFSICVVKRGNVRDTTDTTLNLRLHLGGIMIFSLRGAMNRVSRPMFLSSIPACHIDPYGRTDIRTYNTWLLCLFEGGAFADYGPKIARPLTDWMCSDYHRCRALVD